jgi:hypothetical protein
MECRHEIDPRLLLASIALSAPTISHAQVAGSTLIGVSVAEMRDVSIGMLNSGGTQNREELK